MSQLSSISTTNTKHGHPKEMNRDKLSPISSSNMYGMPNISGNIPIIDTNINIGNMPINFQNNNTNH